MTKIKFSVIILLGLSLLASILLVLSWAWEYPWTTWVPWFGTAVAIAILVVLFVVGTIGHDYERKLKEERKEQNQRQKDKEETPGTLK